MTQSNVPPTNAGDYSLGEITRTMQRMDSRLERIIEDHEARLRRVERWMYILPPTVLMAGASVIVALLRGGP